MVKINKIKETEATLVRNDDIIGRFNTDLQLNDIRLQIKRGKLKDYAILWENIIIFIDINGNLSEWPKGFFDILDRQLSELAGWEVK